MKCLSAEKQWQKLKPNPHRTSDSIRSSHRVENKTYTTYHTVTVTVTVTEMSFHVWQRIERNGCPTTGRSVRWGIGDGRNEKLNWNMDASRLRKNWPFATCDWVSMSRNFCLSVNFILSLHYGGPRRDAWTCNQLSLNLLQQDMFSWNSPTSCSRTYLQREYNETTNFVFIE